MTTLLPRNDEVRWEIAYLVFLHARARSAVHCEFCKYLTLVRSSRLPRTNDRESQKTDAPTFPVMLLAEPKFPMEIHWIWTPSPKLLATVAPIKVKWAPSRTEMPAP